MHAPAPRSPLPAAARPLLAARAPAAPPPGPELARAFARRLLGAAGRRVPARPGSMLTDGRAAASTVPRA
jgi:hypothetical protein